MTVLEATGPEGRGWSTVRKWTDLPISLRVGFLLIGCLILFGIVAIARGGNAYLIIGADRLQAPSSAHWFGTDEVGRDVLARTLNGLRLSLLVAFSTTALAGALAVSLGLVAGWVRGRSQEAIGRILDLALGIPSIVFVLLAVNILGFGVYKMVIAMAIIYVAPVARVIRAETQRLRELEFVEAATARGERLSYVLGRELLPNLLPLIVVELTLRFGFVVILAGALSFLGLGVQPPEADLGLMIAQAKAFLPTNPYMSILPGLVMVAIILSANLLGDGLRDYLDRGTRS